MMTTHPKDRRAALLSPHQTEHDISIATKARHPQRLRDYLHELMEAHASELPTRLHKSGVEWEPAPRDGDKGDYGGSKLGTPSWTVGFRAYVTGPACATDSEGEWRWPLRSSIFRMSISRSGTDRTAARFVYLLTIHRYNVREAWAAQCGILADPAIADVAESWAAEALRRWWGFHVESPFGKALT